METRANYVLIGLFTLVGFVGILGFLVWLTNSQLNQQYTHYQTRFTSVSGLDRASTVRFAGLSVGQVTDLQLSPNRDGTVTVIMQVDANTPVRTGSTATITAQGVTGTSYIEISPGEPNQALLVDASPDEIPEIPAAVGFLQSLTEDVPNLINEVQTLITDMQAVVGPENRQRVDTILSNLEDGSADIRETLDNFSKVASSVGTSVSDIATFTEGLSGITKSVEQTLEVADGALEAIRTLSTQAEGTLTAGNDALESATRTFDAAQVFLDSDLRTAVGTIADTFERANTTLAAVDEALASSEGAIAAAEGAFRGADQLINEDLLGLSADLKGAVESFNQTLAAVTADIPAAASDIRSAADAARVTMEDVSRVVSQGEAPVNAFLTQGLPQFTRLANEAQRLLVTLEQLTRRLENDPGRFLLGRDAPEFRR
jgi:phospholipid/cholesterol/gamma-HCH transport system substrate-binding protein